MYKAVETGVLKFIPRVFKSNLTWTLPELVILYLAITSEIIRTMNFDILDLHIACIIVIAKRTTEQFWKLL